VAASRLTIAQVTPYTWGSDDEVNEFVTGVSAELGARGHEVIVAAPAGTRKAVRRSAQMIDEARDGGETLGGLWSGERIGEGGPPVVPVGQGIPIPRGPKPRAAPFPLDTGGALAQLLTSQPFDVVHVHDPFAPSASSAALRHSQSLNVGSFHEPTERILSTQVARPLVEIFLGRLDARTVVGGATGELMGRFFPGGYERVPSGAAAVEPRWPGADADGAGDRPVRIAYCAREERGALRLVLRALRKLSLDLPWEAVVWLGDEGLSTPRVNRALAERLTFVRPDQVDAAELVAGADIAVMASGGPNPAPRSIYQAFAAGTIPVAAQIEHYSELVGEEETGLMFPPGDEITLVGQLERLVTTPELRSQLSGAAAGRARSWSSVADDLEAIYEPLCARRHDPVGDPAVRKRISARPTIDCDLHMHTDHSNDCATPVEVLLETAKDRGMGAIAVTDHNEISGALAAREAAERDGGIKVIVGEEVKTAEQGEVIGLFIEEKIERGMSMRETIDEIRRQGGLVYVPHPFDRLHSVPDYEHLLDIVEDIDILEVFNPRVAFSAFNEEAERFAAKYRIVPGAGSDGHVAQALGSVRIRLHEFEGPEEFLEAMRSADIVRKHKNLVYVQALKWMQAASGQAGGRKQVSDPKPVQGGRRKEQRRARGSRKRRSADGKS